MNTNIRTASIVSSQLKDAAKRLADLPDSVAMHDARALAFVDVSSALTVCAIHLADFVRTNDKTWARKYLSLGTNVAEAITLLSGADESRAVGLALLRAQETLVAAHREFQAHINALLTANSATVQA